MITKRCIVCGDAFNTTKWRINKCGSKYCSHKCQLIGINKKKAKNCLICGKVFYPRNTQIRNGEGKYCSQQCYYKSKVTRQHKKCKVCNNDFTIIQANVKKGYGLFCSHTCRALYAVKHQKQKDTDIELMLKQWLIENNIPFEEQKIIHNIAVVDFFINPNICLFADGDYWHNLPGRKERDLEQNEKLNQIGYKVIRLLGSSIKKGIRPNIKGVVS